MIMEILFLTAIVFVVQYFIMSRIETNSHTDITNNLNKIYLSTISALSVAFLYVLLYDFKTSVLSANYYIGLGIGIGLLTWAYRNQWGVTEYDWINTMIEKQSEEILVTKAFVNSNQLTNSTNSTNPTDLAINKLSNWMIKNQQEQLALLKNLSSQTNCFTSLKI
jgi:hypothetical protein